MRISDHVLEIERGRYQEYVPFKCNFFERLMHPIIKDYYPCLKF
jgi:hypothetical protein